MWSIYLYNLNISDIQYRNSDWRSPCGWSVFTTSICETYDIGIQIGGDHVVDLSLQHNIYDSQLHSAITNDHLIKQNSIHNLEIV